MEALSDEGSSVPLKGNRADGMRQPPRRIHEMFVAGRTFPGCWWGIELPWPMADIERVLLFGSHARGDWVEDFATGYMSDFDLLVLVANPALAANEALWACCHDRARDAAGDTDTPVSLLVHTIADVNEQISRGNSFFRDVIAEGIVLHDAGRLAIAEVTPLTPAQHHALAQAAFPRYFERAAQRYASFEHSLSHAWHAIAAFELHQIAETLCKAVLLVCAPPT